MVVINVVVGQEYEVGAVPVGVTRPNDVVLEMMVELPLVVLKEAVTGELGVELGVGEAVLLVEEKDTVGELAVSSCVHVVSTDIEEAELDVLLIETATGEFGVELNDGAVPTGMVTVLDSAAMSQPVGEPLGEYGEYGVSVGSEDENKDEVALREAVTGLFGVEEGDVVELTGSVSVVVAERVSVIIRVVEGVLELEFVNKEELDAALLEDETPVLNGPDGTGGEYGVRVGTVEDNVELSEAVTGLFGVEDCATPVPGDVMVELARDEFGYTPLREGLPLLSGAVGEDSEYGLETSVEDEEVEFGAVTGPFGVYEGEVTVLVKDMVEFKNWRELVPEMLEDPVGEPLGVKSGYGG
ncbi:hypothetical protein LTR50_007665 [Elasticomyces elasticus]|nr:hypothetical protein LTR50_007665 [Elasticomyces elasticus]